jgi:cytoskeletal protein CcmA (bactofilin family)
MKRHDLISSLVHETEVTVIGEGVQLDGNLHFAGVVRVYGTLRGKVHAQAESSIVLMESAVVEGELDVDSIVVAGFVRGDIHARTRVSIEGTGRVIGNIDTPKIAIEFGAYLEGDTKMSDGKSGKPARAASPAPSL